MAGGAAFPVEACPQELQGGGVDVNSHPGIGKMRLTVGIPYLVFSSALRSGGRLRRGHLGSAGLIQGGVAPHACADGVWLECVPRD